MDLILDCGGNVFSIRWPDNALLQYPLKRKEKRISKLMLDGVISFRRGAMKKPQHTLRSPMNVLKRLMTTKTWLNPFTTWG